MKNLEKWSLFIVITALIMLSSCEKNEISSISINKTSVELNIGQNDTLIAEISFTGEFSDIPLNWTVDNNSIVSISELSGSNVKSRTGNNSTIEKKAIITALRAGTTKVTIGSGEKSISCDITVVERNFSFNQAYISNWGDYYDIENNNFDMFLLENTLSFDTERKAIGSGTILYLDFHVPITQNELAEGYFSSANTGNANTFFPGEGDETSYGGAHFIEVEGDVYKSITLIQSGHFEFIPNGDSYRIEGEMITELGEVITFTCSGPAILSDKKEIPVEINPAVTKGNLYYYGDIYQTNSSNNFLVELLSENAISTSEEFKGEMLLLEFNTSLLANNHIPDGTYNMISKSKNFTPLTLVYGFTTQANENWGCWYYSETTVKKLKTGNAIVGKSGETYTIQYELYDRFGSKIYGYYSGTLNFIQGSQAVVTDGARIKRTILRSKPDKIKPIQNKKY